MKLDLAPEAINILVMALDTSVQAMAVLRAAIVAQAQSEQQKQVPTEKPRPPPAKR